MRTLRDSTVRTELVARLRELRPDSRAQWGKMSAHQMVCHLNDSFLVAMGQRPASSISNLFTKTFVRWVALHTPLSWPKGVKTIPEVDQTIGGSPPVEFKQDVEQLLLLIDAFGGPDPEFDWQAHPIFGPLSEREWLHWGYRHVAHHLRQFGL